MAVTYEQIVAEDLNLGIGTVPVTMPAGGSATGTRINGTTFGLAVSLLSFNPDRTGQSDTTQAFLDAIGSGGVTVHVPVGTYYVGAASGDGINILYDDVNLVFDRGAVLKVKTGCCGITIARAANTTVHRVGIYGVRITSADTTSATAGIRIAPDATNIAYDVTIDDFLIDTMGQYGIVVASTSGGVYRLSIRNGAILNNGSTAGTWGRNALILNPSAASASTDVTIDNVVAEQLTHIAGTSETDACKIQNFTRAKVSNFTCRGGGGNPGSITGAALVFNANTDLVATNLVVIGTGATGLQLDTSATGRNEISNVTVAGTFTDAIVLSNVGSNKLTLRGVKTDGGLTSAGGTHTRLEIVDCVMDAAVRAEAATLTSCVLKNNTFRALSYLTGSSNVFQGNLIISSAGAGLRADGNSNVFRGNILQAPTTYGIQVAGNTNVILDNYTGSPGSGSISVISGTGNLIGMMLGDTSITDAGTSTVRQIASVPLIGGIGTYVAASTTPDVTGVNYMHIANSGGVTITNFLNGVTGQVLVLSFADANTTVNRANCFLAGGANFVSSQYDTLVLVKTTLGWVECGRAANS